jgi:hypothetical protein
MARFKDTSVMQAALQPQLEPGETLLHWAYGVKQPPIWLIVLLMIPAILPGVIAVAVMTREYVVGLTDRRFIALQFSGSRIDVKEVRAWRLNALPPVRTSTGGLFTHIAVRDPVKPFAAKFHRLGTADNREQAMAIAEALERGARG